MEGDQYYLFGNGLALIRISGKYGFIDRMGKVVIDPRYDEAEGIFREGLAWVMKDGKYGFADTYGREIIPLKYDAVSHFYSGLARVGIKNNHGEIFPTFFIDQKGREYIEFMDRK